MGLTCRDVMVPTEHQKTVAPDTSVAEAMRIMRKSRTRFLPVVGPDGTYLGVFSAPTLLKLILPKAATIGFSESARMPINHLHFMDLEREDFDAQMQELRHERVADNLSNPANIPVAAPDMPVMEGIFLVWKFKRHVMLVEPKTKQFIGTISANSVLNAVADDGLTDS